MLNTIPPVTLDDPLTQRIISFIAGLPAGSKLPSERILAERLGVSRTALRDRFGRLESTGILVRRAGAGTFVHSMSPTTTGESLGMAMVASNRSPSSMIPVRIALEREAAREASLGKQHLALAQMSLALEAMDNTDSVAALRQADLRFHQALFAASTSDGLAFFADVVRDLLESTILTLQFDHDRATMRRVHQSIHDAVLAQEPQTAMAAIDQHFGWLAQLHDEADRDVDHPDREMAWARGLPRPASAPDPCGL